MNARMLIGTGLGIVLGVMAGSVGAQSVGAQSVGAQSLMSVWSPESPGIAFGVAAGLLRTGGTDTPLKDVTVGALLSARNSAGIHQIAFGVATEAWSLPGSRSVLVGIESAVINEEPTNTYAKIANNAVFKNRADGAADPGEPRNANSIAYWITAQPGTGFERGLSFSGGSMRAAGGNAAAIDLSDLSDEEIATVDLIRIRKDVSLRYDVHTRTLVLHDTRR